MSSFEMHKQKIHKPSSTTATRTTSPARLSPPSPVHSGSSESPGTRSSQGFDLQHIPIFPEQSNKTGLPDSLKSGIETLSGMSLDDVRVHYHSPQPARVRALAYTQGADIYLRSGQEKHLPHEAWHVIQQKQRRVKPTMNLKGAAINDAPGLEKEAETMGKNALQKPTRAASSGIFPTASAQGVGSPVIQRVQVNIKGYGELETSSTAELDALIKELEEFKDEELNKAVEETFKELDPTALTYVEKNSAYWRERGSTKGTGKTRGPTKALIDNLHKAVSQHEVPEDHIAVWRFHSTPQEYQSNRYRRIGEVSDAELEALRKDPVSQAYHMYKSSSKAKSAGVSYTGSLDAILDQAYHTGGDSALRNTILGPQKQKKQEGTDKGTFTTTSFSSPFSFASSDPTLPMVPLLPTDAPKKKSALRKTTSFAQTSPEIESQERPALPPEPFSLESPQPRGILRKQGEPKLKKGLTASFDPTVPVTEEAPRERRLIRKDTGPLRRSPPPIVHQEEPPELPVFSLPARSTDVLKPKSALRAPKALSFSIEPPSSEKISQQQTTRSVSPTLFEQPPLSTKVPRKSALKKTTSFAPTSSELESQEKPTLPPLETVPFTSNLTPSEEGTQEGTTQQPKPVFSTLSLPIDAPKKKSALRKTTSFAQTSPEIESQERPALPPEPFSLEPPQPRGILRKQGEPKKQGLTTSFDPTVPVTEEAPRERRFIRKNTGLGRRSPPPIVHQEEPPELPVFSLPAQSTDVLKPKSALRAPKALSFSIEPPSSDRPPLEEGTSTSGPISLKKQPPLPTKVPKKSVLKKTTSFAQTTSEIEPEGSLTISKSPAPGKSISFGGPLSESPKEKRAMRKKSTKDPSSTRTRKKDKGPVFLPDEEKGKEERQAAKYLAYTIIPKSQARTAEDVGLPKLKRGKKQKEKISSEGEAELSTARPSSKEKSKPQTAKLASGVKVDLTQQVIGSMQEARDRSRKETEVLHIPPSGSKGKAPQPLAVFLNPFPLLATTQEEIPLKQIPQEEIDKLY